MIAPNGDTSARERSVEIRAGKRTVRGMLTVPQEGRGVVAFAHGSGSGRLSPRNQFVAQVLQQAGLATLLIDLLEEDETRNRRNVFDIELLAERLQAATDWLVQESDTRGLRLGYFRASTGAAAALVAAGRRRNASKLLFHAAVGPTWRRAICRTSPPHPADRRRKRRASS